MILYRFSSARNRRDPNDGVTVVWVLGLETHPRLEPRYHLHTPPPHHTHTIPSPPTPAAAAAAVTATAGTAGQQKKGARDATRLEPLVRFFFSFFFLLY